MASKRKLDNSTSPPKKKVKMSDSAKKNDGSSKPKLNHEWTRTNPITGERGKLYRKDIDYYTKQLSRRTKHINKKKKSKKKTEQKMDDDDDLKMDTKKKKQKQSVTDDDDRFASLTNRFENHVCVVTGGGRGIGQSIALRLAQEGGIVYILDKLRWKETVQLLNDTYGDNKTKCDGMRCDVTDEKQVTKCIESIIDSHGYIDVLINAVAQLDDGSKHSHEVSINELQKSMNKNFYGFFNVSKVVLPYMKSEEYGRIVNIASINGKEGRAKHFCHSISTAALIAGTKTMGKEYAGTGVTVNCVAPLVDYQVKQLGKQQAKKETKNIPMGRAAEESELAGLVAFIASEENTYTTGFCYDLSGGYTI